MFSSSKQGRKSGELACIFVHAGAGYHSVQNEQHHLAACNDAAKAAMALMRAGGSAVDAVEIAVKVLEDREITNAGYGSNLAMDGVVECDAVVVDHFGRSGAAGAVAQIKNPISLARLLLDHTTHSLSLRRVPPNLLVGQGATDFAHEQHMPILPLDAMISPAARERWRRWKNDLIKAETNQRTSDAERYGLTPPPLHRDLESYMEDVKVQEDMRRTHSEAMLASVWNEGQPISPPPTDNRVDMDSSAPPSRVSSLLMMADVRNNPDKSPEMLQEGTDPYGPPGFSDFVLRPGPSRSMRTVSNQAVCGDHTYQSSIDGGSQYFQSAGSNIDPADLEKFESHPRLHLPRTASTGWHDGSSGSESGFTATASTSTPHDPVMHTASESDRTIGKRQVIKPEPDPRMAISHDIPLVDGAYVDDELITDTVGAIAIDLSGNIACGASSGGIGMKHRGRIGPAALVGIGAAVIPCDEADPERQSVATVTSGTGEHMGTTQAAGVCSERIYQGVRKVPGGRYEEVGEEDALRNFIERDFMGHPSVRQSHSNGAIGILSIKKSKDGIYLYFAHNTDSFALASMHSDETKPVCTMSRNKGNGSIAQGGRGIRFRKRKA